MAIGDQYFSNVVLVCSFDSAFVDESFSANTITAYGTASTISTIDKKYGISSLYYDGTASGYLYTTASINNVLSGDFTIELWAKASTTSSTCYILANATSFSSNVWILEPTHITNPGKWCFFMHSIAATGSPLISTSNSLTNTWTHIAITKQSSTYRMFIDGVQESTYTNTSPMSANSTDTIYINGSANRYTGYIDDLRITKGVARYTANFTPPTLANPLYYGQVQGTVRDSTGNYAQRIIRAHRRSDGVVIGETLSNPLNGTFTINTPTAEKVYTLVQDHDAWITYLPFNGENNSTVFEEWNGKQVTPYGNAKISTAQSKFGGASAYFDGAGDYLTITSSQNFAFGINDYTIEAWIKTSTNNTVILDNRIGGINEAVFYIASTTGYLAYWAGVPLYGTTNIADNNWHHVVWCRYNNVLKMFVDGIQEYSNTNIDNLGMSSRPLTIAAQYDGGVPFNGYIDDLKISKGKAQYLANFTPPTQPHFTPQEGDPYWNNVVLGCHFDGYVDNGDPYRNEVVLNMRMNALTDDTGKAVTVVGNTTVSTSTKKYGSGSAYFDGVGDYLTLANSADWAFGSGDFTIEYWFNLTSTAPAYQVFVAQRSSAITNYAIVMFCTATVVAFSLSTSGTSDTYGVGGNWSADTGVWHHLAVSRSGGTLKLFLDGVVVSTSSNLGTASIYNSTAVLSIGGDSTGTSNQVMAYIDDLRITKGIARYTTDFTPPTVELPAITGSKWIDPATGKTITPYGNAAISATQSKFGGYSAYFDGNGDYLSIPYSADFVLPNSGFTIEAWVYIITNSSQDGSGMRRAVIFGTGNSGVTSYMAFHIDGDSTTTGTGFIFEYQVSGNAYTKVATYSITQNTWHHVAICADNSSTRFYLDGVVYITTAISVPMVFDAAGAVWVGRGSSVSTWERYFPGYIDDFRITKGVARYTSDFTPPNAAFYNNKSDTDSAKYNALIYDMVVPA